MEVGGGGKGEWGWGSSELVGWVLLYVHRNSRLIRDGSPGWPPRLSHGSWAVSSEWVIVAFYGMFLKIHPSGVFTAVFGCGLDGAMRSCRHLGTHSLYTIQPCTNFFLSACYQYSVFTNLPMKGKRQQQQQNTYLLVICVDVFLIELEGAESFNVQENWVQNAYVL